MGATLVLPPYQSDPNTGNSRRTLNPTIIPIADLIIENATEPEVIAGVVSCIRSPCHLFLYLNCFLSLTQTDFNFTIQNLGPSDANDAYFRLLVTQGKSGAPAQDQP